jgi:hypothetical protein
MLSKKRLYDLVILNGLLLFGGVVLFYVILSRNLQPPALSSEAHRALIEQMTSIDKLREMAIKDDIYIRSLENLVSTQRSILLFSGGAAGIFALLNLVWILWRKEGSEPPG